MNAIRSIVGPSDEMETLEAYERSVQLRVANLTSWLSRQVGAFHGQPGADLMAARCEAQVRMVFRECWEAGRG